MNWRRALWLCTLSGLAVLAVAPARAAAYTSVAAPTLTVVPGSPFATDPNTATGSSETALNVSYGPGGNTLVVANRAVEGGGGSLTLMNVAANGALSAAGPSVDTPSLIGDVAYDPLGGYVAVVGATDTATNGDYCGSDGCLSLYAVGSNGSLAPVGSALNTDQIQSIGFSPDGALVVATVDSLLGFSVSGGNLGQVSDVSLPSGGIPQHVAFSPDGSLAAVPDVINSQVDLFSVSSNGGLGFVGAAPTGQTPIDAGFSPDGSLLAVANRDSYNLSVFDVAGDSLSAVPGSPFTDPYVGDDGPSSLAFSPRGWLAVVYGDGSLETYNVATNGALQEPGTFQGVNGSYPTQPEFSPSGQFLDIPDSGSGTVYVYADHAPPIATISSPASGGSYTVGQQIPTVFSCTDSTGAPGIASCTDSNGAANGTGALNTSAVGTFTYSVTTVSQDGLSATAKITYSVSTATPTPTPAPSPSPTGSGSGSGPGGSTGTGSARASPAAGPFTVSGAVSKTGTQSVTVDNPNAYAASYQLTASAAPKSLGANALTSSAGHNRTSTKPSSSRSLRPGLPSKRTRG